MFRKGKFWIAVLAALCALVLLAVWLVGQKNEVDPFRIMETAAGTRIERNADSGVQSCAFYQYDLSLNSAFPGLNIQPVQKEIDKTGWTYRITYNFYLEEDAPERIVCLIGEDWIVIGETAYTFSDPAQWVSFGEFMEQTFDNCVAEYGIEE